MASKYLLEICCDSVESALIAEAAGADRIELCENLYQGGVTPSIGKILFLTETLSIPLHILIRPRKGDFLYNDYEVQTMIANIAASKELGIDGVVIGCLTAEGDIDLSILDQLVDCAEGLQITFHRAFDMCRQPLKALQLLKDRGVHNILTSGGEANVVNGKDSIISFVNEADDGIKIIACGQLLPSNLTHLTSINGLHNFHSAARKTISSQMEFRGHAPMGDEAVEGEFQWHTVDGDIVQGLKALLK